MVDRAEFFIKIDLLNQFRSLNKVVLSANRKIIATIQSN